MEQIRTTRLTDQLILTQDENMVDIDLAVQYNIKSAEHFLFRVRGPDETLESVVEAALREVIGSTLLDSVLTTGSNAIWSATKDLSLIHISEPTRLLSISYAVFCLKKKK